jgi:hypothetical protein
MSRLLWVGVGAAGGIYTYRKGQRAWDRAKERGVGGNAAVVAAATTSAVHTIRLALLDPEPEPAAPVRRDPPRTRGRGQALGVAALRAVARPARSPARTGAGTLD